jgi:hypothetical protein
VLVAVDHRRWSVLTTGGRPVEIVHEPGSLRLRWDHLVPAGELDPAADRRAPGREPRPPRWGEGPDRLDDGRPSGLDRPGEDPPRRAELGGSAELRWTVQGRALHLDLALELDAAPDAVTVVVPESGDRTLVIDQVDTHGGPDVHRDRIDVRGIAEWRSFWTELPVVHQLDLDRGPRQHLSFRVTPELRVASTAHSHHYDRSLYEPLAGRARSVTPPIGPLAGVVGPADPTLRGIDLFHLHWPEWFAFDDLDAHRHAIALLADRRVPVVWTAHNLTPHDKRRRRLRPCVPAVGRRGRRRHPPLGLGRSACRRATGSAPAPSTSSSRTATSVSSGPMPWPARRRERARRPPWA